MTDERQAFDFVESAPIPAGMSGKRRDWPKRYREFVETGLAEEDEDIKLSLKELCQTMRKPQSGKHTRNDAKFYFEG
jgi:hypothetical protein